MATFEILTGTGILLFAILLILIIVLLFKFTGSGVPAQNPSPKEDLKKIKAQIEE